MVGPWGGFARTASVLPSPGNSAVNFHGRLPSPTLSPFVLARVPYVCVQKWPRGFRLGNGMLLSHASYQRAGVRDGYEPI